MSYAVKRSFIEWVTEFVPAGHSILELGSGEGTTAHLSKMYRVYSVEHNAEWLHKYGNGYIYAPLVNGWYDLNVMKCLPTHYELLIVDGPCGKDRGNIINNFHLFLSDIPIIIDDTDRVENKKTIHYLKLKGYRVVAKDTKGTTKHWTALIKER